MPGKFHKERLPSKISQILQDKKGVANNCTENFKISFQYVDSSQKFGSGFKDWQNVGLLSKMLEVFQGYCCSPLIEQMDGKKFTTYNDGFPPKDKTYFKPPSNIPEDAKWARIHITGKAVVVGHIVTDTFYVVFLDKTHKFWLTKRITEN